ncbi:MAG: T9SS type A sorting domain-containing protein [Flavobacteriales bacterium]|nr:T9SS type A sorting domain-containing protein [Flavobacteriales bacterium]
MKNKNFLVAALMFLGSTAFAQVVNEDVRVFEEKDASFMPTKNTKQLNKREVSGWYNYVNNLRQNGETFVYLSDIILWPDSLPLIPYPAGSGIDPNNVFAHSVGSVFDPNSFYYVDPEQFDSRFVSYTVDSIAFFYKYHNFGDYTDSLRIQFYDPNGIIVLTWNAGGQTRSVSFNRTTLKGRDAVEEIALALDSSNNTPLFFLNESRTFSGAIQVPVGITVEPTGNFSDPENLFAFTIKFEPGNPNYSLNDTMNRFDSTRMDGNQMSIFSPYTVRGDGAASSADASYNHGLMLYTWGIYGATNQSFWYPLNPPSQPESHLNAFYHVTASNVGLKNMNANGYGLGQAYPNPAQGSNLFVPFALGKGEQVSVQITDLSGRVVRSVEPAYFGAGEHKIKIDISDLSEGVYIYELNAGDYSSSNKVVVQ